MVEDEEVNSTSLSLSFNVPSLYYISKKGMAEYHALLARKIRLMTVQLCRAAFLRWTFTIGRRKIRQPALCTSLQYSFSTSSSLVSFLTIKNNESYSERGRTMPIWKRHLIWPVFSISQSSMQQHGQASFFLTFLTSCKHGKAVVFISLKEEDPQDRGQTRAVRGIPTLASTPVRGASFAPLLVGINTTQKSSV